ncbi:hypothetical protein EV356DRAFT_532918 [Viridothelium virens]|uniref:C2H2-type domain-containing protein n=1 Tax=Viridothelium virens TaxID=1048519 RepID=A0A6A6HA19_VIRVR|nr:hypothetical protein EV356DRAFT_532918 [Viridothelium virens]
MDRFAKPLDATFRECIDEFTTINESEDLTNNSETLWSVPTDSFQLADNFSESDSSYLNSLQNAVLKDSPFESTDAFHFDNNRLVDIDGKDTNQLSPQPVNEWQRDDSQGQYGNPTEYFDQNELLCPPKNITTNDELFSILPNLSSAQNHVRLVAKSETPPKGSESFKILGGAIVNLLNNTTLDITENKSSENSEKLCDELPWTAEEWTSFISSLKLPLDSISTGTPCSEVVQVKPTKSRTRAGAKRKTASAKQNRRKRERPVILCKVCGQQFSLKHQLNRHFKRHTCPHKCPIDGCAWGEKGFYFKKDLNRHIKSCHRSKSPTHLFPCLVCGCPSDTGYSRFDNLLRHHRRKHDENVDASKLRQSLQVPKAAQPADVEQPPVAAGQRVPIKLEATSRDSEIQSMVSSDLSSCSHSRSTSNGEEVNREVWDTKVVGDSYDSCSPIGKGKEAATFALACIKVENENIKVEKGSFDFRYTIAWPEEDSEGPSTKVEGPTSTSSYGLQALEDCAEGSELYEDLKPAIGKE